MHFEFLDIVSGLTRRRFCFSHISYFSKFFIFRVKFRIIISLNTDFNPGIKEKEEKNLKGEFLKGSKADSVFNSEYFVVEAPVTAGTDALVRQDIQSRQTGCSFYCCAQKCFISRQRNLCIQAPYAKRLDRTRPWANARHVTTAAEGRLRAAASDAWGSDIGASALASVSVAEGRETKMFSTFRRRWVRLGHPAANISFF